MFALMLFVIVFSARSEEHDDETFKAKELPMVEIFRRIRIYYPDWSPNAMVDIGANKGEYSTAFRKLYPSTKMLMLEATPGHSQRLGEVVNEIGNAEFHISVVSSKQGEVVQFYQGSDTGNSMFRENSKFYENDVPINRTTTTLDAEIANSFLKDEQIDVVKADVQGAELVVLEGGIKVLEQATFVTFEASTVVYNEGGACPHEVDAFLRSHGFYLYDMSGLHYNYGGFKTFGVGQYDVLYVKPDSPRLPRQLRENGVQFCTHGGRQHSPEFVPARPEQPLDSSFLLSHGQQSILVNIPTYQFSYLSPWMMGFLCGFTVAILSTKFISKRQERRH